MPEQFWVMLGMMLALILWTKIAFWLFRRVYRKISKTNFLLALSRLLMYVLFVYVIIGIFAVLFFVDFFELFRSVTAISIIYDVLFVWLPFLVLYFLTEWFIVRVIQGRKF